MSVLIVIPCLNEENHIEALVRQMVAEPLSLPCRIVIVDGGSTDCTVQIAQQLEAEFSNVAYLQNQKRLQSAAVNLAVATYAGAELLIRLDAHADYPVGYCQTLIDEAEATGAASIVVAMETVAIGGFQKAVAAAQNSKLGNGGSAHRSMGVAGKFVDHGHHALMRNVIFIAAGKYDETFSHNEDAEFDTRLLATGYKIWLTNKTSLKYYPRATPTALFRQYLKYGQGRAATILKHRTWPKLRQLAPAAVLPALLLAWFGGFWVLPFIGWLTICLLYGIILALKAKDAVILLSGLAAIIMHMAWSIGFWRKMVLR